MLFVYHKTIGLIHQGIQALVPMKNRKLDVTGFLWKTVSCIYFTWYFVQREEGEDRLINPCIMDDEGRHG
jgi:hypothetical protein